MQKPREWITMHLKKTIHKWFLFGCALFIGLSAALLGWNIKSQASTSPTLELGFYKGYSYGPTVLEIEEYVGGGIYTGRRTLILDDGREIFEVYAQITIDPRTHFLLLEDTGYISGEEYTPWTFRGYPGPNYTLAGGGGGLGGGMYNENGEYEGSFIFTYDGVVLSPQDIELTNSQSAWDIKDWKARTLVYNSGGSFISGSDFIFENKVGHEWQSSEIGLPSVDEKGSLILKLNNPNTTGTFHFSAYVPGAYQKKYFTVTVLASPTPVLLSPESFEAQKNNILEMPDTTQMLSAYGELIDQAPSPEALLHSFNQLLDALDKTFVTPYYDAKTNYQVKALSSKILESLSTFSVPSYSMDNETWGVLTREKVPQMLALAEKIEEHTKRVNAILSAHNIDRGTYSLESQFVFFSPSQWNDAVSGMSLFTEDKKILFEKYGIYNVALKTQRGTLIFKPDSFYEPDPIKEILGAKGPSEFVFRANQTTTNRFDLKVFLDGIEFKDFYGAASKEFYRPVSVHLPYEPDPGVYPHLLHVMHEDPSGHTGRENRRAYTVNKGGAYHAFTKEMRFDTNHFSIFFINISTKSFEDVNAGQSGWAQNFVEALAARGVLDGLSGGNQFLPTAYITRAETSMMVANAFDLLKTGLENPFYDISDDDVYRPHVLSLYQHGIVRGAGDGYFYPNQNIKRQDMAIIIANTILQRNRSSFSLPDSYDHYLNKFEDKNEISPYAKRHVAFLAAVNILNGTDGKLLPHDFVTRAQMSAMIYQALQIKNLQGFPFDIKGKTVDVT
jgi:hypothetical protein